MIEGLHHIAILASKRAETLVFYEALGFVMTENHVRPERNDEIIFMEQAGVTLEVFISAGNPPRVSGPEAYGLRHVAFRVSDSAAVREALIRKAMRPRSFEAIPFPAWRCSSSRIPMGFPSKYTNEEGDLC